MHFCILLIFSDLAFYSTEHGETFADPQPHVTHAARGAARHAHSARTRHGLSTRAHVAVAWLDETGRRETRPRTRRFKEETKTFKTSLTRREPPHSVEPEGAQRHVRHLSSACAARTSPTHDTHPTKEPQRREHDTGFAPSATKFRSCASVLEPRKEPRDGILKMAFFFALTEVGGA